MAILRALFAKKTNLRPGERYAIAFQQLGPAFIKLGQVLSTRGDIFGRQFISDLAHLKDKLPAFPRAVAEASVIESLGKPVDAIFSHFGEVIGSASIAQAHEAILLDGRKVAVKILRPGIEQIVTADIAMMTLSARIVAFFFPSARRLEPVAFVATVAQSLLLELDLRLEASACDEIGKIINEEPWMKAPKVVWHQVSRRVLVTEWADGTPLSRPEALTLPGLDHKETADNLIRAFLSQALDHGAFHADLHEGNLFVSAPAQLTAIDFGIIGRLRPKERRYLAEMLWGFLRRDYKRVAEVHFEAGYVPRHHNVDSFAPGPARRRRTGAGPKGDRRLDGPPADAVVRDHRPVRHAPQARAGVAAKDHGQCRRRGPPHLPRTRPVGSRPAGGAGVDFARTVAGGASAATARQADHQAAHRRRRNRHGVSRSAGSRGAQDCCPTRPHVWPDRAGCLGDQPGRAGVDGGALIVASLAGLDVLLLPPVGRPVIRPEQGARRAVPGHDGEDVLAGIVEQGVAVLAADSLGAGRRTVHEGMDGGDVIVIGGRPDLAAVLAELVMGVVVGGIFAVGRPQRPVAITGSGDRAALFRQRQRRVTFGGGQVFGVNIVRCGRHRIGHGIEASSSLSAVATDGDFAAHTGAFSPCAVGALPSPSCNGTARGPASQPASPMSNIPTISRCILVPCPSVTTYGTSAQPEGSSCGFC
ncbi:MAG: AarF/UbiB family protein [Asticcacaulis sp.]